MTDEDLAEVEQVWAEAQTAAGVPVGAEDPEG
jgi:hypothetical protein